MDRIVCGVSENSACSHSLEEKKAFTTRDIAISSEKARDLSSATSSHHLPSWQLWAPVRDLPKVRNVAGAPTNNQRSI